MIYVNPGEVSKLKALHCGALYGWDDYCALRPHA